MLKGLGGSEWGIRDRFEWPLEFLMNPDNHQSHSAGGRGKRGEYYAMPNNGQYIWGATAGMLKNMYDRIYGAEAA